jgi:hypothetical protein
VFSLTSEESFLNLEKWLNDIDEKRQLNKILKIIVGSKADEDGKKEVQLQKA